MNEQIKEPLIADGGGFETDAYSEVFKEVKDLIDRDVVFYWECNFRHFLHLSTEDIKSIPPEKFNDYCIMVKHFIQFQHLPFISQS